MNQVASHKVLKVVHGSYLLNHDHEQPSNKIEEESMFKGSELFINKLKSLNQK
jgi:hypothetical protein